MARSIVLFRRVPNKITILEFKTGQPRPEHQAQLHVYHRAAERLFPGLSIDARLVYAAHARNRVTVASDRRFWVPSPTQTLPRSPEMRRAGALYARPDRFPRNRRVKRAASRDFCIAPPGIHLLQSNGQNVSAFS